MDIIISKKIKQNKEVLVHHVVVSIKFFVILIVQLLWEYFFKGKVHCNSSVTFEKLRMF